MTKLIIFTCIIFVMAAVYGAGEKESHGKAGKVKIYQMTWESDNVSGSLYVNGFLINTFKGTQDTGTAPLNVWLAGNNEFTAELKKAKGTEEARISIGLSEMYRGEVGSTSSSGSVFTIEKKNADFVGSKTVKISRKFKSSIDFTGRFNGKGAAGEKDIIEYAKKVHNIIKKKDKAGIAREFAPKIEDYAKSFSNEDVYDEVKNSLIENLTGGSDKLADINPGSLKAIKAGTGSGTWHVVEGGKELIRFTSPQGSSDLPVYIGTVNGSLKVIR
ncbi:MAG: hypothetical protein V1874_12120 [Spirochaetota bacterium]